MDSQIAVITVLPAGLAFSGLLLLWSTGMARRNMESGVAPWVRALRTVGAAMVLVGILVPVAVMTHVLAVVFVVATLAVVASSLHRVFDSRRQSLLWVMAVAAERGIPLHQAVRAFAAEANDRLGDQAARLSDYLEAGLPLGLSLQRSGLVVSPAVQLAADLGQHTGTLGPALRRVAGSGTALDAMMRTLLTRMFYLGFLASYVAVMLTFSVTRIVPALARVYDDFGMSLPLHTRRLVDAVDLFAANAWAWIPLVGAACGVAALALAHYAGISVRRTPLLRGLWWPADRALILHWLASSLRQRRPAAETIRLLAGYFPSSAGRRRLEKAAVRIDRGEHWAESLCQCGVIGRSQCALFQAAERAGNLPWALDEMADSGLRRLACRCQAGLDVAFPALLAAFGGMVLLIALGILAPLFTMISSLA
jgi:general secretion pathway protein F